jgi:hypothetical protein
MENLLPAFQPPRRASFQRGEDVVKRFVEQHPPVVRLAREREHDATLARLRHRSGESELHMDGWPLNPPHFRHTVVYGSSRPAAVKQDDLGDGDGGGDGGRQLLADAPRAGSSAVLESSLLLEDASRSVRLCACASVWSSCHLHVRCVLWLHDHHGWLSRLRRRLPLSAACRRRSVPHSSSCRRVGWRTRSHPRVCA